MQLYFCVGQSILCQIMSVEKSVWKGLWHCSVVYVNRNIRHLAQAKVSRVIKFSTIFYPLSAKEFVHKRCWQIVGGGVFMGKEVPMYFVHKWWLLLGRVSQRVSRANSKKCDIILPSTPHIMFSSGWKILWQKGVKLQPVLLGCELVIMNSTCTNFPTNFNSTKISTSGIHLSGGTPWAV